MFIYEMCAKLILFWLLRGNFLIRCGQLPNNNAGKDVVVVVVKSMYMLKHMQVFAVL